MDALLAISNAHQRRIPHLNLVSSNYLMAVFFSNAFVLLEVAGSMRHGQRAGRQRHCPMDGQRCLKHVKLDYAAKVQELSHESSSKLRRRRRPCINYHLTRSRSGRLTRPSKIWGLGPAKPIIGRQNSSTDLRYMGSWLLRGISLNFGSSSAMMRAAIEIRSTLRERRLRLAPRCSDSCTPNRECLAWRHLLGDGAIYFQRLDTNSPSFTRLHRHRLWALD